MPVPEASAQKRMSRMTPEELKDLFGLQELPASPDSLDPKSLPDEDLQAFSYEGLSFEEAAGQLWRHTKILHYHAGTYNRQSEWFPVALAQLEKDIRLAGSFCLTRAVLEMKGFTFKEIGNFTIESLCGLTAFYFRKCGKAFEDIYYTAGLVSLPMHEWERRWYLLGERLKATGEKIRKINAGEIRVDELLKRAEMIRPEKGPEASPQAVPEAKPFYLMGGALPLIGSYARLALRERKEEARSRRRQQKLDELVRRGMEALDEGNKKSEIRNKKSDAEMRNSGRGTDSNGDCHRRLGIEPEGTVPAYHAASIPVVSTGEKRKELIRKAKERGDSGEMMKIAAAPPEEIDRRWELRADALHRPPGNPAGRRKKKGKKK